MSKADRCKALLNDPDLQQAFDDVKAAIFDKFAQIKPSDTEKLVECRRILQILDSVKANLYRAIEDGKLAQYNEEQAKFPILGDLKLWKRSSHRHQ